MLENYIQWKFNDTEKKIRSLDWESEMEEEAEEK